MNAPFRSAIAARSALAARALLCAFLAACAEPPVSQALDKYTCPADGGPCTLSPEFGVVQGSVVYQGTRRGDVVLLLFASNDLPPPDGTAKLITAELRNASSGNVCTFAMSTNHFVITPARPEWSISAWMPA